MMLKETRHNGVIEVEALCSKGYMSMLAICSYLFVERNIKVAPIIFFTDAVRYKQGESLYKYIKKHELGEVVQSKAEHNPNSGNRVRVWSFIPDMEKLREFWRENKEDWDEDEAFWDF